jgi:hypothetical protein
MAMANKPTIATVAGGGLMELVLPDNKFHHEGVLELLLKRASEFPSGSVTSGERSVIER